MKRTWVISWFEWNGEKAVGTKTIYKTVNCNNYTDREAEKYSLKEETLFKYNLHPEKMIIIREVLQ